MRKNGWKLPCHPLQVVAVSVFLALGFAFYVFFAPFVGRKLFQYILIALYTPLITCVFGLYIWCAGADPADPGVFKSKKYLHISDKSKSFQQKDLKRGGQSTSSTYNAASAANSDAKTPLEKDVIVTNSTSKDVSETEKNSHSSSKSSCFLLVCSPCAFFCKCSSSTKESSEQQMSEEGMFYCSLCEVEVFKYSKHCRVCDKCVDRFDHHCRWLNNCIGRKNYRQFFTLMVASLLLLILQWSTGILVLICCFVERKHFSVDISSKLGSSFSLVPFVIVVAMCTILAMFATLPLAQLFFFHVLLIKKGISTYDYIIALREQEQEQQGLGGGPQSPQMSVMSSLTGLSSASSFNTFQHAAWCTPPRLFLEDQFDVVPPETGSVSSLGKMVGPETAKKRNAPAVKISSWTLARLNAEEVSKAATEARKKSKILQPVVRQDSTFRRETDSVVGSSDRQMGPRSDNNRRRATKRVRLPADLLDSLSEDPAKSIEKGSTGSSSISLLSLQFEARSAFQTSRAMAASSSPESSLDSPDIHPFRASLSGAEESRRLSDQNAADMASQKGIFPLFLRSTSDGYEASGGEDSDRVSSRIGQNERIVKPKPASSSGYDNFRKTGFNG